MLDFYKLDLFLRVAEEGSFSKAAIQLHMSQPAVSQHVLALEQQLGTILFERSRQGVTLTAAGRKLQGYAEAIIRLVAEAELSLTDMHRVEGGEVQIGATPGVSSYLFPDWVQGYREQFPNVKVGVFTGITPEIIEGMLRRTLNLGVIEGELDAGHWRLGVLELEAIDQLAVIGPRHPWWGREAITLNELHLQAIVMRQAGSQTRIWLDDALRAANVQPRVIAEMDNIESIKRIVMKEVALTILPAYTIHDEQSHGQLQALPIVGHPLRRTLKLLWNRGAPFSPVTYSFLQHLKEFYAALSALGV